MIKGKKMDKYFSGGDVMEDGLQYAAKAFKKKSYKGLEDFGLTEASDYVDLNKEYGLLSYYDVYSNKNKIPNLFNFLANSIEAGQWSLLDLNQVQIDVTRHFKYLALKKAYTELAVEAKGILYYDSSGFHIEEHTFENLDEVKRALANKMFL
jgi:hypothetical protein